MLTPEQRSRCMSLVKGKNTGPELKLRKILWAQGLRYRLGYKLPGKPDLVFVSAKIAVFVDGCFWHGCPIHGEQPKTNQRFWSEKINKTKLRDQQVNAQLVELGWSVIRYWEHDIERNIDTCTKNIYSAIIKGKIDGTQIKSK
ncbi:very short patch repair endonuclease [Collimonas sp. PA-H2]|uniref:very short patch repair endonuclease n=1 Tax=Collimonas sp. PA-H2 TaxID=1881062 RepID=UPI0021019F31|nr:very short patch repair endonuclease [Collimonas sp. PA-H2]